MTTDQHSDATAEADLTEHGPAKWFRRNPAFNLAYRVGVGIVGGIVLIAGIVMIPYPGPGWLVVFAGLAILSTEFAWAGKVLKFAKRYYDAWMDWLKAQSTFVKLLVVAVTGLVVVLTLWLVGAFSLVGGWLGIEGAWLESPIFGGGG